MTTTDWNPDLYGRFAGLRLRPALDLLSRVADLPPGPIFDMGCGSGAVGGALATRFSDRDLIGLDQSPAMLEEAEETGHYTRLIQSDATTFTPDFMPALIFSNALCHWLPDHATLFAGWADWLPPGGMLAVQMPRQFFEPSHALLREIAETLFPDRFDFTGWQPHVAAPETYARLFPEAMFDCDVWETRYIQRLAPTADGSHPVRNFTQSTAMRPVLEKLGDQETTRFLRMYEDQLAEAYPVTDEAGVLFPFQRLFFTVRRASGEE
ncbi:methyltransferase domain-containing protein [Maritimibacter dapengensis]|uniref:Methyltransferase domain-containing protein n=1 Tax=Maritimibacter dapengensis TaxID=2836868 RepID=A0ABS6T1N4_9RHOB|nr:methyltransferase domain-containing protein [Maritimibacter dapengensis]MBV7378287.1 methyltransferase domain-containing protein [Maritimibacter dapengensis]